MRTSIRGEVSAHPCRRGTSIIELMIALTVVLVGVGGYLMTVVGVDELRQTSDEQASATQAAQRVLETLRSEPFRDLAASYNDLRADDPEGPGSAPGSTFEVAGLGRRDEATPTGRIVLPLDATGAVREDLDLPQLGLPRDLNGDGVIDKLDHRLDYQVLPVLVSVEWNGRSLQQVSLKSVLTER